MTPPIMGGKPASGWCRGKGVRAHASQFIQLQATEGRQTLPTLPGPCIPSPREEGNVK